MFWKILVGAVAGMIGFGIAELLTSRIKSESMAKARRTLRTGIGVFLFLILNAFGQDTVRDRQRRAIVDGILLQQPYTTLKTYEPALYAEIESALIAGADDTTKLDAVQRSIHAKVVELANKYMPRASSEALCNAMKVEMAEVQLLARKNVDVAYDLMFPQNAKQAPDVMKYLDSAAVRADANSLVNLIETGAPSGLRSIDTAAAKVALKRSAAAMGAEVSLLSDGRTADKGRLIAALNTFYQPILALPSDDCANAVRFLLASK